jgi:lysophospholipase L1-like esterase
MADINKLKDKIKSTIYPNGKGAINASDHQALLLDMADGMAETDTKLTELSEETIVIRSTTASNTMKLSEALPLSTEYESGVVLWAGDKKIQKTTSTAYGVVWVKVEKGASYHLYCSKTYRYPVYANAVFVESKSDDVAKEIISVVTSEGETEVDVFYTSSIDGYIGMMVWDGTKYLAETSGIPKEYATKGDVLNDLQSLIDKQDIPFNKVGWARIGATLYEGTLAEGYKMSELIATSLSSTIIATLEGNGTINSISFFNNKKEYLSTLSEVSSGINTYRINLAEPLYQDVAFVQFGISGEPQNCFAILEGKVFSQFNESEAYYKPEPISISKIGWARIGTTLSQSAGSNYAMSEMIPIEGHGGIKARLRSNGVIDSISFYDIDGNYLQDLSIITKTTIAEYQFTFGEKHRNAAFITVGIMGNNGDMSDSYAELLPYSALLYDNKINQPCRKVLCIGDSLTNSLPPQEGNTHTHKWAETLCHSLNIPSFSLGGGAGANVANVGNNTIYQRVMNLEKEDEVDIITFWGGTNDWGAAIQLGVFAEQVNKTTRDNTTFIGGLCDCVEKILTLYPTSQFILIGTTPRTWESGESTYNNTTNNNNLYLKDYVDAVKSVAEWYGLPFLDLLRTGGINTVNIDKYMYKQSDNQGGYYYLHFNQYGEDYVGRKIASFLRCL